MKILITGCAGFIGFHLVKHLVNCPIEIIGIDNINDYYDVNLKYGRLAELGIKQDSIVASAPLKSEYYPSFTFIKMDMIDKAQLQEIFADNSFDIVCNLAAQAGVRYSLTNPHLYIDSNITGFLNVLEMSRLYSIKHLVYASSSSVYGLNKEMPFSTTQPTNHPASIYAATKKANELMAHCYSHLYNLPTTGLRFFTVYGPWGRPDMAMYLFTKAIIENKPISVFNMGEMRRDFTYIDDIVKGIAKIIESPYNHKYQSGGGNNDVPSSIFNIGKGSPVKLLDFVAEIEKNLGITAKKKFIPMQDGDVAETWANVDELYEAYNYLPKVTIEEGVKNFIKWYKEFYTPVELVKVNTL
jgi:UDP-glucuronate 4-epimerase